MNVSAASISTGGPLSARIIGGGNIVGSANINFNLTGDLTTRRNDTLLISKNRGRTIGADAVMNVSAASISTGGALSARIVGGGNIGGSANINFNLTDDLTTQRNATLSIEQPGGTIGSDARINVTANNVSTGGALNATIDNSMARSVGAPICFNLSSELATRATRASRSITPMVE